MTKCADRIRDPGFESSSFYTLLDFDLIIKYLIVS